MKFKQGDRVRVKKYIEVPSCTQQPEKGHEYTLVKIYDSNYHDGGVLWELSDNGVQKYSYEKGLILANNKNNMNIKEKFITAFLSEPEKSFRKTGLTNGDGFLTEDGQEVFLGWLLKQNGAQFKTDVVDDLLKEQEKEN